MKWRSLNNNNKWCKCRRRWRYYDSVGVGHGTTFVSQRSGSGDEIHVVVVDEDGDVTGVVKF